MPRVERAEPPYMQVVRHLRGEVLAGRLAEGDTVPSARQIAADWGIALATATKALATLRAEGLVRGVPGVGTVVTGRSVHRTSRDHSATIQRTGRIYPPGHYARIRSAELVSAPDHVAEALGLASGSQVIRRQRTTHDSDDAPISTSTSWFDGNLASVCPELLVAELIAHGTVGYIGARTGRVAASGHDQIAAGVATAEDAAELGVAPNSPVLLGRNWWLDAATEVIEYGESVSPQGRWARYEYLVRSENA